MNFKDVEDIEISLYKNVWTSRNSVTTLGTFLDCIRRSEICRNLIFGLRRTVSKDEYNIKKRDLPCVAFSGCFDGGHSVDNLIRYSNLIVLDIDGLAEEDVERISNVLSEDVFVIAHWISPSNHGIKGLVYIDNRVVDSQWKEADIHYAAFIKVERYFNDLYGIVLDRSGKDISRLCFISYDPNICVKCDFTPFVVSDDDLIGRDKGLSVWNSTMKGRCGKERVKGVEALNSERLEEMIAFLQEYNLSITHCYNDWLRVGFAIANTFNYDEGLLYFDRLSRLDTDKYDRGDCERMFRGCYMQNKGYITFATIVYMFQEVSRGMR